MKIAVRCIYHLAVRPNFMIVDLNDDQFKKFLGADNLGRVAMIRKFIKCPGPSDIREVSWIPLSGLKDNELMELELECRHLSTNANKPAEKQ